MAIKQLLFYKIYIATFADLFWVKIVHLCG